jgi:hypothetical protein
MFLMWWEKKKEWKPLITIHLGLFGYEKKRKENETLLKKATKKNLILSSA